MARRPRYQQLGVSLDRPAQIDFAGLRETARTAQNISQQVERMSEFVYKEQARAAEQRGRRMVADMGAQPALRTLAQQGGPSNIEQRAAFETANRIAAAELETEAQLAIDQVLTEAEINKTPYLDVQQQLQDITDGFPAALSDLDAGTAGLLRQRISLQSEKAANKYSIFYNDLQVKAAQGRALKGIDVRTKNIMRAAQSADEERDRIIQLELANLESFMRDLQFDEDDIQRVILNAKDQTVMESTLFDFRQLGSVEEQQAFIASKRESLPGLIGEEKARSTMNSLQTEMNKTVTGLSGQATQAEKAIEEQRKILTAGGVISEEKFLALEAQVGSLGDYGADAQQELNKLRRLSIAMEGFRQMNPTELQDTISQLQTQGVAGMGQAGLDTTEEVELQEQAIKLLNTMNTELQKDPLSFGVRTGIIDYSPIDFFASPEVFTEQVSERISSALAVSSRYGIEPTFLTDEEANTMITVLEGRDVGEKMALLTGLYTSFGQEHVADVFAQLAEKDAELGHVAGLLITGNHQVASEALAGMQLIKDGYKAPEFTPTNTDTIFNEMTANAFVFQSDAIISGKAIAKSIYAKRAQRMGLDMFDETLWRESISAAFGQSMGMGGLQPVFEEQVLLPSNVSASMLEDALNNMTEDDLYRASGVKLSKAMFNDLFRAGPESVLGFALDESDPDIAETEAAARSGFNSEYSLVSTGYGKYAIILGDPGTAASEMVGGMRTDEFGDDQDAMVEIDIFKLLRM